MDVVWSWTTGNLDAEPRIISAVMPAVIIIGYLALGVPVYLLRARRYRDEELEQRGSSVLLSMPLRIYFSWAIRPFYRLVERSGLPPRSHHDPVVAAVGRRRRGPGRGPVRPGRLAISDGRTL